MAGETNVVWLVGQLPHDVQDLYRLILQSLGKKRQDPELFVQVLRWALFQNVPLKSAEFSIAYALGTMMKPDSRNLEDAKTFDVLLRDIRQFEDSLDDNVKIRVEVFFGHVVKFRDERLG
ncbi:hypothetical protein MMYC01_206280 [Madurella mycetomatis]|uniref:Uncharacterized protein n=1 Tax=Madurella mycetomatis TaxID=100816 RepID=A0A175W5D5_9PEZI|nr:hypothetical protein MMYC01_206640 [Madurella mycetomatis]KXX78968.1 hypothetical protein MMYC01_206280 [Madurella mycetomatis]